MTSLQEKLTSMYGAILAYDGQFGIWTHTAHPHMTRAYHDLRDVLLQLPGVSLSEVIGALPSFESGRRKSASVQETELETQEREGEICTLEATEADKPRKTIVAKRRKG